MKWQYEITEPGFYYFQTDDMATPHVIVCQVSEFKYPDIKKIKYHIEMLLPVSGPFYEYNYEGAIEGMPDGLYWGPLPQPTIVRSV